MSNPFGAFFRVFDARTLYLTFLHFDSDRLPEAMRCVREACRSGEAAVSDLESFFDQPGWREHLVGCAAMLVEKELTERLVGKLWSAFDSGSWVSPQVAVTAWLRDPYFEEKAKCRIETLRLPQSKEMDQMSPLESHVIAGPGVASERAAKGFSSLLHLLGLAPSSAHWLAGQLKRDQVKAFLEQDVDRGGIVAERWLERLRANSQALRLEIK